MSSILTVLVIAVVLLCFVWFEFILRILYAFGSRKKAYELSLRYETRAIHLIFSLLATYRGFRITYENCLNGPLPNYGDDAKGYQSPVCSKKESW